jgi:hypothetical protein
MCQCAITTAIISFEPQLAIVLSAIAKRRWNIAKIINHPSKSSSKRRSASFSTSDAKRENRRALLLPDGGCSMPALRKRPSESATKTMRSSGLTAGPPHNLTINSAWMRARAEGPGWPGDAAGRGQAVGPAQSRYREQVIPGSGGSLPSAESERRVAPQV